MTENPPFTRPDGTPVPADYLLHRRKDRGTFEARITIDQGPKFSGKRIVIPFHTRDESTARAMRDAVLTALDKSGVLARKVIPQAELG